MTIYTKNTHSNFGLESMNCPKHSSNISLRETLCLLLFSQSQIAAADASREALRKRMAACAAANWGI